MKLSKLIFVRYLYLAASLLVVVLSSCKKEDDTPLFPSGTVTLNMNNELHGKTYLFGTRMFINKANNFYSVDEYFFDEGAASGIGRQPDVDMRNLTREASVVPGHVYRVYDERYTLRFPSGNWASAPGATYYRVYVDSFIKDKDDKPIGAVVKYLSLTAPQKIDVIFTAKDYNREVGGFTYRLPNGAECMWANYINSHFDISIKGNVLTMKRILHERGSYVIRVRDGNVYYKVIVEHD